MLLISLIIPLLEIPPPCHTISCFRPYPLYISYWITLWLLGRMLTVCPSWVKLTTTICGLAHRLIRLLFRQSLPNITTTPSPTALSLTSQIALTFVDTPGSTDLRPYAQKCLDSLQHSSFLLSTHWVVWELCPCVLFSKTTGGTWQRTPANSHHRVYSSMAWQMNDSGPMLSQSPWYNHWHRHWSRENDFFPSYLPPVFP